MDLFETLADIVRPQTERLYIIDPTVKYEGWVTSTMLNGIVDYSDGLTLEQYREKKGNPNFVALTFDELRPYDEAYAKGLQGDWVEVTEEQYDDMLNCLPPCKWHNLNSQFNSFYISEEYTHGLHSFYIKDNINEKYYTARRHRNTTDSQLLSELYEQTANY